MSYQSMEFHGVKCSRWSPRWEWTLNEKERDSLEASLFNSGTEEDILYYEVNFKPRPIERINHARPLHG